MESLRSILERMFPELRGVAVFPECLTPWSLEHCIALTAPPNRPRNAW